MANLSNVRIVLVADQHRDLSILVPLALLQANTSQLGRAPYLTYVSYAIMGVHGHLSETPKGTPLSTSYDLQSATLYFVSEIEVYSIADRFGIVPRGSQRTLTSANERSPIFLHALTERDLLCITTGGPSNCCNLVALAAGSDYITKTCRACRTHPGEEPLTDINDVRNGILLNGDGHQELRKRLFLIRTPNLYLTSADIHRDISDPARVDRLPSAQFTFHWLELPIRVVIDPTSPRPENTTDRIPNGRIAYFYGEVTNDNCPASAVLDFVFGCGFLHLFGTSDMLKFTKDFAGKEYGTIKQTVIEAQEAKQDQKQKASIE
ncbi:hypothetical protein B0H10DRAFT_310810 [Mycena sp. CBHHK59/15]|nr:hypothetical protein B0H10DRAFT_310810 [Mycena sp. CBHHK59/15]